MDISNLIKPIKNLRSCIRQHEGGGGQCAIVNQEVLELLPKGAKTVAGFFVTKDGELIDDHWWIETSEGYIIDPTQDQFGKAGFGDVAVIPPNHSNQSHYFPFTDNNIPYDAIDFSEKIKEQIKKRGKAGLFSKLIDDYGGRPVGDPNSQSRYSIPQYVTTGGQEVVPGDENDEDTPEEFQQKLRDVANKNSAKNYNKNLTEDTLNGGAGVLIYDPVIKRILVQKRKDNGLYDLFGGTLEEGETFEECARREAYEEGGLKFPEGSLKEIGTVNADAFGEWKDEPYVVFLYKGHTKVTKLQNKEVAGFEWIDPRKLNDENATSRILEALNLKKTRKKLPVKEGRQRGILYHFTDLHGAWSILSDGVIKIGDTDGSFVSAGGGFVITHGRNGISLTRNPNLRKGSEEWGSVRITLDGDKLSNRYKIEPHIDTKHGITKQMDQAEELIRRDKVNIRGAIISVEFNYPAYIKDETNFDDWVSPPTDPESKKKYTDMAKDQAVMFVRWARKEGYPIKIVKKFERRVKEVDHPEFMPGGNESPRYDPNLYLGNTKERHATYNTGHPDP